MSSLPVGYKAREVPFIWSNVKDWLEQALKEQDEYTLDDIYHGLLNREMQLWANDDAALVTSIQENSRTKFCTLLACGGGQMQDWLGYLPALEDWARAQGCTEMRLYGRRGWAKVLNYDAAYTVISKGL